MRWMLWAKISLCRKRGWDRCSLCWRRWWRKYWWRSLTNHSICGAMHFVGSALIWNGGNGSLCDYFIAILSSASCYLDGIATTIHPQMPGRGDINQFRDTISNHTNQTELNYWVGMWQTQRISLKQADPLASLYRPNCNCQLFDVSENTYRWQMRFTVNADSIYRKACQRLFLINELIIFGIRLEWKKTCAGLKEHVLAFSTFLLFLQSLLRVGPMPF